MVIDACLVFAALIVSLFAEHIEACRMTIPGTGHMYV